MSARRRIVLSLAVALSLGGGAVACSALLGIQGATARPAVTRLAAGGAFACALLEDGTVWCWGADDHQQLGHLDLDADAPCRWASPDGGTNVGLCNPTPSKVAGLHGVKEIAVGTDFACALLGAGEVDCWGNNDTGQLGPFDAGDFAYSACPGAFFEGGTVPSAAACTPVPTRVRGIPPATAITAGSLHACAATTGGVYCWGNSSMNILDSPQGGLGPYLAADVSSAVALASPVTDPTSPYTDNTCALVSPESTICWGSNNGRDDGCDNQPCPLVTQGVASIHVGYLFGCSLGSSGALDCWGENSFYAFDSTTQESPMPTPSDYTSVLAPSGKTIALFEGRSTHALVIDNSGGLWAWGDNRYGQLGVAPAPGLNARCDDNYCVSLPVQVNLADGGSAKVIATGVDFSLALTADGTVWAWGANTEGQLGFASDGAPCAGVEAGAKPCVPMPTAIQVPP